MEQSKFQFSNPVLLKLNFNINDDFHSTQEKEEVQIKPTVAVFKDSKNGALVKFSIDIGEKSNKCRFYISATMQAVFKWDENTPQKDVDNLLAVNAPALLLSYIRPYIAQITESSPINTIHIPFMNFYSE